jgi:hypothetical protein
MDKIYPQNNYIVIESVGLSYFFPQNESVFYINNTDIVVSTTSRINTPRVFVIDSREISSYYDQNGNVPYSYDTLIDFLTTYTSRFCNFV